MDSSDDGEEMIPTEQTPAPKSGGTKKRGSKGKKVVKKKGKSKKPILLPDIFEEKTPQDFEHYVIGEKLGRGAFGAVYKGLDTDTGQMVAIKTIQLKKSAEAMDGVKQEIELMKMLDDKHIVKYIGSHTTNDFLYIVMEYVPQGSLQQIQKKFGKTMNENLVARYICQVVMGLEYLHSQSIIHRDIKAANILISNDVAKLSDFGISIKLDENTKNEGDFNFSAYWTAPEVISMEPITEKCDIWSIGITAIELFCGEPPYFDLAAVPAAFKIIQNESPPLPEDASNNFTDFLKCCLTKNVAFRKSAAELLQHPFLRKYRKMDDDPTHQPVGDDSDGDDEYMFETVRPGANHAGLFNPAAAMSSAAKGIDAFVDVEDSDGSALFSDTPRKAESNGALLELSRSNNQASPTGLDDFMDDDDSGDLFTATPKKKDDDSDEFGDLQPMGKKSSATPIGLDTFMDDEESGDFFNDLPESKKTPVLDSDSDDFGDLQPMTVNKNPMSPKGLDAFMEKEDSGDFFNDLPQGKPSIPDLDFDDSDGDIMLDTNRKPKAIEDFANEDDDDMEFEGEITDNSFFTLKTMPTASTFQISSQAPLPSFDEIEAELDEACNDSEDSQDSAQNKFERQKGIMSTFKDDMDKICMMKLSSERINEICGNLSEHLRTKNPWIKERLPRECVAPFVQIIQSRDATMLGAAFPLILLASESHPKFHKVLCIMGVLPFLFEYVTSAKYSESLQVKALTLLHMFCTTQSEGHQTRAKRSKPLQMFIAAGGLLKLCEVLVNFPHDDRPILTAMVLDIVTTVFTVRCGTPKSSFARILTHANFLDEIAKRYLEVRDPSQMKQICNVFEIFSSSDSRVKWHMAVPSFVDILFQRAAFKAGKKRDPYRDLTNENLATIMRCMNNISMDKEIVQLLWVTKLPEYIFQWLQVDAEGFKMTEIRNTAFSALFHMVRAIQDDNLIRITPIVPVLIFLINSSSAVKDLAINLFLDLIINHSTCPKILSSLKKHDSITALFKLLEVIQHKEQIIHAMESWAAVDSLFMDRILSEKHTEFVVHLVHIFNSGSMSVQSEVAVRLGVICHLCRTLTSRMAMSKLVKVMIRKLMGGSLTQYDELRRSFASNILAFYKASVAPKHMVAQFRIDRVGKKLRKDPSADVREIAEKLLQGVASNYVL